MAVSVITDSAAALPSELSCELGILVVPMSVVVGGVGHTDGELALEDVMEHLDEGVSTAGAAPGAFVEAIEGAADEAVILTVSQEMSSTFQAATVAARTVGGVVRVLDTETAAGGEGLVVLAAARAAARGESVDGVVHAADSVIQRVQLTATLDNLDRLVASGRVPGIAAAASKWLGLLPMFEFRGGHARPMRPAMSRDAALDRIASACLSAKGTNGVLHAAGLHAGAAAEAELLVKRVTVESPDAETFVAPFSSVMVAHTGLGLVGLASWWED